MELIETGCVVLNWIKLSQIKVHWQALVRLQY